MHHLQFLQLTVQEGKNLLNLLVKYSLELLSAIACQYGRDN